MAKKKLLTLGHTDQEKLSEQIELLKHELDEIQKRTRAFEALLRSHVSDLIVEAQKLFILYKKIKKAKKLKRLEQKKRGKNYKEPKGLQVSLKKKKDISSPEEQKEKKRLYREAMLHVHPDKFYMSENQTDIATEITRRLIEIYKTESLEALQAYHAHIFKGNTHIVLADSATNVKVFSKDNYLQQEKERLEKELDLAKNHQLYKVITEYENPLAFVEELKSYYIDRISKLKKRTRKGLK
ncbi:MAG: hypothetical protein GY810_28775 [Aureispira sp.]|nr:hypothetical protein [Aureispira sp.]